MARAIWKGHISFGLVEIPVSLHKAEDPHEFDFTLVDRRDHSPIGYERINKNTGKKVEWDDIVKAHESHGELVLVSDEELAHANVEATRTIDILDFVDGAQIHPAYFERPYYLAPANRKGGAKAYTLLREALERSGKIGIATIVLRTRQHLAALTTKGPALALVLLRFADELRSADDLDVPEEGDKAGLKPKELEMAEQLVDSMTSDWEPERYTDTFFRDVKKMLERKRKSGETEPLEVPEEEKPKRGAVVDLMPLLQQSMERGHHRAGGAGKKSARKTTKTRAKKTGTKKKAASTRRRRRRASA